MSSFQSTKRRLWVLVLAPYLANASFFGTGKPTGNPGLRVLGGSTLERDEAVLQTSLQRAPEPHDSTASASPAPASTPPSSRPSPETGFMVLKRDGSTREPLSAAKVQARLEALCEGLDRRFVDPTRVADKVLAGVYDGVATAEIDTLAAETAAYMSIEHPDYTRLAARITVSALHRRTPRTFLEAMRSVHEAPDPTTGEAGRYLDPKLLEVAAEHAGRIEGAIDYARDFDFDYFGIKTLERAYLLKGGEAKEGARLGIAERPQHMFMRVALGIHGEDVDAALETYELLSCKWLIHASPTLFHAGTRRPQLSSCFLLAMQGDSIDGIYDTLKQCAQISKAAGGIGFSASKIRATGSLIRGTQGVSNGLVPMLRVFDATARYVDQGGGKRPGAFAVYLEPWHADVFEVLDLRKNTGKAEARARDLFYGLWIPDLFMRRVEEGGDWSLMCPDECPGLDAVHGSEFEALYERYESEGRAKRVVKAQDLWFAICDSQIETGTPYMLYKDACNSKSNQQNLGTITCSNLCTEIVQFTSASEAAVCNLASLTLPNFVTPLPTHAQPGSFRPATLSGGSGAAAAAAARRRGPQEPAAALSAEPQAELKRSFDFAQLRRVTMVAARNLNKVIDVNLYPVAEAERSNKRHRPMGLGVNGLADVFLLLGLPFDSPEARRLNSDIFEAIYFAALEASCELAESEGKAYESYQGSPLSEGKFQFDLWGVDASALSGRWDWEGLRRRILRGPGVRNSLLVAPMPTASTAQILGNNESIEPFTSNMYNRRTLSGEFVVVNKYLLRDLINRGLWTQEVRTQMIADQGSVQQIRQIPQDMKDLYKTVWEIKQKVCLDMAADRGAFICQSQSLNIHMAEPTTGKLTSMHFYAWRKGLKTGMYYLRTKAAANAIQFTVDRPAESGPGGSGRGTGSDDNNGDCDGDICLACQ
mmetsp:Transcript_39605/g.88628  ORF Transcript_39605/g.88628 Transcript_39605/m.88628 type:complete len:933 (-) Transcript_39605:134-2932(-)